MYEFVYKNRRDCFFCGIIILLLVFCFVFSGFVVHAEEVEANEPVVSDTEIAEENMVEDETSVLPESVPTDSDSDEVLLIFEPLSLRSNGSATLEDVYNVLVHIYNFLLMSFIVALIVWTYNMITSAFRRFIY